MKTSHTITDLLPTLDETCIVVSNFLDAKACDRIIEAKKLEGYSSANSHYPTYYRNNERSITDKVDLAEELFQKVKDFVPQIIETSGTISSENGTWQVHGINERLRFCRYLPGQFFGRHLDGVHYRSKTIQSKLTFMVYLNDSDEFEGGRTLFYADKDSELPIQEYYPKKGDLMIFDHNLWHEGEKVTKGEKYILRSDILYKRTDSIEDVQPKSRYANEHLGYIWKLMQLGDGRLVSSGRDKVIRIWNAEGKVEQELKGHANSILSMAQLPNGNLVTGSRDSTIRIWKQSERGKFESYKVVELPSVTVLDLLVLKDNRFLSAGSDGLIRIFDQDGAQIRSTKAHEDWIWQLQVLEVDKLVSVSQDGMIKVWSLSNLELISSSHISAAGLTAVVICNNSLFVGDGSGRLHQWNWVSNQLSYMGNWQAHEGIIRTVIAGKEGVVLTGSEDNFAKVWAVKTGKELQRFKHENFVQSLVYLRRENKMLSSAYDGEIREWSMEHVCRELHVKRNFTLPKLKQN